MASSINPSAPLDHLCRADRVARAASVWLRFEQGPGAAFPEPGPAHRDLLAGLVAGLGDRLGLERTVQLLAAYSLALMEYEQDSALDLPYRIGGQSPRSPDYREGLRVADRLVDALGKDTASQLS